MKKLLSLLSVLTISGTAVPTTIATSPYQKEETINGDINYLQTSNLETLNRNKRQNRGWNNPKIEDIHYKSNNNLRALGEVFWNKDGKSNRASDEEQFKKMGEGLTKLGKDVVSFFGASDTIKTKIYLDHGIVFDNGPS